ncbi:hypothetical protein AHF37_07326 [Paragonimus kellicotti]|nr:hypothetical protein AHF37_07326 [Paragonimus kellicotti]
MKMGRFSDYFSDADVNHYDNEDMSPLMLAAKKGYLDICQMLLDRQARLTDINCKWESCLMLAVLGKLTDVVENSKCSAGKATNMSPEEITKDDSKKWLSQRTFDMNKEFPSLSIYLSVPSKIGGKKPCVHRTISEANGKAADNMKAMGKELD